MGLYQPVGPPKCLPESRRSRLETLDACVANMNYHNMQFASSRNRGKRCQTQPTIRRGPDQT